MSTSIHSTFVVQLHVKVDVTGDFESAEQLKLEAVTKAMNTVEQAIKHTEEDLSRHTKHGEPLVNLGLTVESGKALVNDEVVNGWFE